MEAVSSTPQNNKNEENTITDNCHIDNRPDQMKSWSKQDDMDMIAAAQHCSLIDSLNHNHFTQTAFGMIAVSHAVWQASITIISTFSLKH